MRGYGEQVKNIWMVRFGHGSYSKLKGGLWEIRRGTKDASAGEGTQIYEGKGGKRTC